MSSHTCYRGIIATPIHIASKIAASSAYDVSLRFGVNLWMPQGIRINSNPYSD